MRLSTAILKGSKGRKQAEGTLRDFDGAVCALGAACYGVGITPKVDQDFSNALTRRFPILQNVTVLKNNGDYDNLQSIIADKNDEGHWGFKRIANWLRKLGF